MSLFTSEKRNDIKTTLIEELKKIEGIVAIILVGSGSIGFRDEMSDLDFCIITESIYYISSVMDKVKTFICNKWGLLDLSEYEKRGLQVYMLDNYLEIDIGYVSYENVSALRKNWLVIYDRTGEVENIMRQSWDNNKNNHGKKKSVDIDNVYLEAAESGWHFLMHAIVGIKRENYWRAIGEMDIVRNMLIELLGYKYSLETKRFRNVDELPNEIRNTLQKTIPKEFNLKAFRDSINILINIFYDEIDDFYNNDNKIKVTRKNVKEYYYYILGNEF